MLKAENAIFGGATEGEGRSKIILIPNLKETNLEQAAPISLTPHHREGYCIKYSDDNFNGSLKN